MPYINHVTTTTDFQTLLTEADIIPTQQRLEIARVILSHQQHLSADQVLALVNQEGHKVSKATVYNTLGLFARKGIVREVLVDPNRIFFDSNTTPHHHLYNEDTGALHDVNAHQLRTEGLPMPPEDTEIVGIDIVVRVRNVR
jgi:Fur family iron response transcriptional regulator